MPYIVKTSFYEGNTLHEEGSVFEHQDQAYIDKQLADGNIAEAGADQGATATPAPLEGASASSSPTEPAAPSEPPVPPQPPEQPQEPQQPLAPQSGQPTPEQIAQDLELNPGGPGSPQDLSIS